MSLWLKLKDNNISLEKLTLPSRYYLFKERENYIKLLTVGEGLFPNDKINTKIDMINSNLILTSESALKVYPSKGGLAVNRYVLSLKEDSNLEFLNDEIIMFKNSCLLQFFSLNFDESSTFFYSDLFSAGRSFEEYDFEKYAAQNRFSYGKKTEYTEKFKISGLEFKEYLKRHGAKNRLFAKIYIKTKDNEIFEKLLLKAEVKSFEKTQNKAFLICIVFADKISKIKSTINSIWELYRKTLNKNRFDLGKR